MDAMFFNPKRYDLGKVGRYKMNQRLGMKASDDLQNRILRLEDVVAALKLQPRLDALIAGRAPHDALYDAVACALLLEHFLALPGWEQVTVRALVLLLAVTASAPPPPAKTRGPAAAPSWLSLEIVSVPPLSVVPRSPTGVS